MSPGGEDGHEAPVEIEIGTAHGPARAHIDLVDGARGLLVLGHGAGGGVGARDLVASAEAARAAGLSLRGVLVAAALLVAFDISAAVGLDPGVVAPGRIAQQLIETGRDSCSTSPGRALEVPLVGLTWTCPPGQPQRISGRSPVGRPKVSYSAASLRVSDDLRQIEVTGLALEVPASKELFGLRARVGRATRATTRRIATLSLSRWM